MTSLQRALVALSTTALAVVLTACSDGEAEEATRPPEVRTTSAADCEARLPAAALDELGWTGDTGAVVATLGCQRRADQGYLQAREIVASDDVQADFDERCATLDSVTDGGSGDAGPGDPVVWLDDVTACAVEPDDNIGLTTVLLVDGDRLVELWVAALESTDQERVRAAITLLVDRL